MALHEPPGVQTCQQMQKQQLMEICAPFAPQAYLLKNDENKALKPAELQKELNNMLKFNPDFAEAVS